MPYPQTVSASFERPAFLPGDFICHWRPEAAGPAAPRTDFAVCSEGTGKVAISGTYLCGTTEVAKF